MLLLNTRVPSAMILPEPISDLQVHLASQNAHWFRAEPEYVVPNTVDALSVEALLSCTSDLRAAHTKSNTNNTFFGPDSDDPGLEFKAELHCGYMISDIVPDARNWSAAVRFAAPDGDARTLLTLNTDACENYMFLQQTAGEGQFKDKQNTLECSGETGTSAATPNLYVVGMSDDQLWLKINDGPVVISPKDAKLDISDALTLFIGCRNNKGRLQKKLGHFLLYDVVVWPDQNVLEPAHKKTRTALDQAGLWRASR
ncbi:MAG: hypothetical protein ACJAVT_001798 [Yoonia sp.]|jgi:hypothetical protein